MAKDIGQSEPTVHEKDPAVLAVQIKSLRHTLENIIDTNKANLQEIINAFARVDTHQYVMQRILRDASKLAAVAGIGDTRELKVNPDLSLDMGAYYAEHKAVVEGAGENAETAVALWSRGLSAEEAIKRASLKVTRQKAVEEDPDYEVEEFGGYNGQDAQQSQETA